MNESMLTGEPMPIQKINVLSRETGPVVPTGTGRRHILYKKSRGKRDRGCCARVDAYLLETIGADSRGRHDEESV